MSRTLSLCEHLLYEGNRFRTLGVDRRALRIFGRLAGLRDLPGNIAEETQLRLAELCLKQRKFAKARRHLTAALAQDPANAECHFVLATSHAEDPKGNRRLAFVHYRRSVVLDPENALYHRDAGLFAIGHGHVEEGLKWLHLAVELAPDNPEVIGDVVQGLQDHEYIEEAQHIARSAFFRNSRNARFQRVWHEFRFRQLHQHQERIHKRLYTRRPAAPVNACLPFLKMRAQA
jgi:tetratricopeptide (TPR) repeat protein